MADTISQYKGSGNQPTLRVPSDSGMRYASAATSRYISNLDAFFGAGNKLALAYLEALENRERRDANTYCNKLFRERRIEILGTVKGKDADGLLEREDKWQQEEYKKFIKEVDIDLAAGKQIWQQHSSAYLDRTGSYMLEQQAAYDEQSRLAASDSEIDKLIDTNVGDIAALDAAFQVNQELFKDKPMRAEQQNDKAITAIVGAWARQNPGAAVQWWKANKDKLRTEWGQKWNNAADMITKAENKLQAEAQHAEVMAARAQRLQEKANRQYSDKQLNNFITLSVRGEISTADFYALTDDPGVSPQDKMTAYRWLDGLEKSEQTALDNEAKAKQAKVQSEALQLMIEHGVGSPEADNFIRESVTDGNLTATQVSSLYTAGEKWSAVPDDAKPFLVNAKKYIYDLYEGQQSIMDAKSPARLEQATYLWSACLAQAKASPRTVAKDFNLSDPESFIRQMVDKNKPIKPDPAKVLLGDFTPGQYKVKVSGKPSKEEANPIADALRKSGKKPKNAVQ